MSVNRSQQQMVLVVEDDPGVAAVIRRALAFEGYRVQTAVSGPEALHALASELPDLMILDVMIPGFDGIEVSRRVRSGETEGSIGRLPILMLTARDAVADRVRGLDAGADDYLIKPFSLDELLARVRALLRRTQPVRRTSPRPRSAVRRRDDRPSRQAGDPRIATARADTARIRPPGFLFPQSQYRPDPRPDHGAHLGVGLLGRLKCAGGFRRQFAPVAGSTGRATGDPDRARGWLRAPALPGTSMTSFWPLRSIRSRLTAWYALLFLVVMLLLGAGVASYVERELRDDVDKRLAETATAMSAQVERAFIEGQPRVFLPPDAFTFPSQLLQVIDTDGRIRFRSENLGDRVLPLDGNGLDLSAASYNTVTLDGVTIRTHVLPIEVEGQVFGAVIAGEPLIQLSQTISDLRRAFVVAAVVGAIVAALGGWGIAARAFRPVDEMTSTARRIASTAEDSLPLESRLAVPATGDEIARLGETFNDLLDRLQESIEFQRRFVADASHELRTPLTAVQGNVDLLERQLFRDGLESADATETIGELRRESQRMARLVTDLLTLARLESVAPAQIDVQTFALMPIVRNAIRTVSAMHVRTPFGIETEANVNIVADQGRFEQVLVILLDNAALHSEPGSPVMVFVSDRETTVEIQVIDRGSGIPAEDLPHIFERFYRADSARSPIRGGSGLGLPIAQAIVKAHGGDIDLQSIEGRGTTATITLPVAPQCPRLPAEP